MNPLTEEIIAETRRYYDSEKSEGVRRYFKEPITSWGIPMPVCRKIAASYRARVKGDLPLAINVVGELHRQGVFEIAVVGDYLLSSMKKKFTPSHFDTFDRWVDTLSNWANTDGLSTGLISETVRKDPKLAEKLLEWTESDNRWRRRASAVSLIPIARGVEMLEDTFKIADRLMEDRDDMVQKGIGWLLKEASKKHPTEVRDYLMKWRTRTSALVLRYASEKLPSDKRVLKRG
ncbi:MAG: DNA alkylation repair protein [Candidatus Bathyarchaeia archaeon]|jgi:3-methyladenine DNA glycosylase AlkD